MCVTSTVQYQHRIITGWHPHLRLGLKTCMVCFGPAVCCWNKPDKPATCWAMLKGKVFSSFRRRLLTSPSVTTHLVV